MHITRAMELLQADDIRHLQFGAPPKWTSTVYGQPKRKRTKKEVATVPAKVPFDSDVKVLSSSSASDIDQFKYTAVVNGQTSEYVFQNFVGDHDLHMAMKWWLLLNLDEMNIAVRSYEWVQHVMMQYAQDELPRTQEAIRKAQKRHENARGLIAMMEHAIARRNQGRSQHNVAAQDEHVQAGRNDDVQADQDQGGEDQAHQVPQVQEEPAVNVDHEQSVVSYMRFEQAMKSHFEVDEESMFNVPGLTGRKRSVSNDKSKKEQNRPFARRLYSLVAMIHTTGGDIRLCMPQWFPFPGDWNAENIAKFYHAEKPWPVCDTQALSAQYTAHTQRRHKRYSYLLDKIFENRPEIGSTELAGVVLYTAPSQLGFGKGLYTNVDFEKGDYITHYEGLHSTYHILTNHHNGQFRGECVCRAVKNLQVEEGNNADWHLPWDQLEVGLCCLYKNTHKMGVRKTTYIVGIDGVKHRSSKYGIGLGAASWMNNANLKDGLSAFSNNCVWADSDAATTKYVVAKEKIPRHSELFIAYKHII